MTQTGTFEIDLAHPENRKNVRVGLLADEPRAIYFHITFEHAFSQVPKVLLGLVGSRFGPHLISNFLVEPVKISPTDFYLQFSAFSTPPNCTLTFSWLATDA